MTTPKSQSFRRAGWLAVAGLTALALAGPGVGTALATRPAPDHTVTICHRTDSQTNPYVVETVDQASVDGNTGNDHGQGDHLANHTGAVWHPGIAKEPKWGDIIPPLYSDGTPDGLPSLNWNDAGQAIFYNNCDPVTQTSSSSSSSSTSTGDTSTSTGDTSTSTSTDSCSSGSESDSISAQNHDEDCTTSSTSTESCSNATDEGQVSAQNHDESCTTSSTTTAVTTTTTADTSTTTTTAATTTTTAATTTTTADTSTTDTSTTTAATTTAAATTTTTTAATTTTTADTSTKTAAATTTTTTAATTTAATTTTDPSTTTTATTTTHSQEIEGATGKPRITPPPTSALGSEPVGQTSNSWRFALVLLAGLLAAILLLTPSATAQSRRR